jgi:hypothetical protein
LRVNLIETKQVFESKSRPLMSKYTTHARYCPDLGE